MVASKVRDIVEVHRILAHPSEEITQKKTQAIEITTTGPWGPCEARLQVKAKRQIWCSGLMGLTARFVVDQLI